MMTGMLVGADQAVAQFALRRQAREWRDHWTLEAEMLLRGAVATRMEALGAAIRALPVKELALARTGHHALPMVEEIVGAAADAAASVVQQAQGALATIVTDLLNITAQPGSKAAPGAMNADDLKALGLAAAPFAAAAGLGLALPAMAVTSGTAMLGLVATSAVSVPILVAGIGGIAALSAFGAINLPALRTDQEDRLVAAIQADLEARLFAPAGEGRPPSLLAQLEAAFADTAARLGAPAIP